MIEKFLSEDERKVADFGDYHLTDDRVIKLVGDSKNREYKDIQLENIASFYHSKNFNQGLATIGGLLLIRRVFLSAASEAPPRVSMVISLVGLGAIIAAYLSVTREYIIRSDTSTSISLPDSKNTIEFWKEINQEKNH